MKFRKKPVVIDAIQYDGTNESFAACGLLRHPGAARPYIDTLEGRMFADPGDWIITGVRGERYPCKPDIFSETYEPAQDTRSAPPAMVEVEAGMQSYAERALRTGNPIMLADVLLGHFRDFAAGGPFPVVSEAHHALCDWIRAHAEKPKDQEPGPTAEQFRAMFDAQQRMREERDRAIGALLCAAWEGCLTFDRARELLGMTTIQLREEANRIFAEEKP